MNTHHAKLSHSQNFLRDPKLVENLVQNSSLENDVVIEIGPGKGIITAVLAKHCKRVLAVEADKNLYLELKDKFSSFPNIEIYHQNFLKVFLIFHLTELPTLLENYSIVRIVQLLVI